MRSRICLVTPLHLSMNPRLVKEADALAEAGYRVTVIAPNFSEWGRAADTAFGDRPWRVVASPHFGPLAPRLIRLRELVRRHGARFLVRELGFDHPRVLCAAWH